PDGAVQVCLGGRDPKDRVTAKPSHVEAGATVDELASNVSESCPLTHVPDRDIHAFSRLLDRRVHQGYLLPPKEEAFHTTNRDQLLYRAFRPRPVIVARVEPIEGHREQVSTPLRGQEAERGGVQAPGQITANGPACSGARLHGSTQRFPQDRSSL